MPPILAYLLSWFLLLGAPAAAAESVGGTLQQGGPQGDPVAGVVLTISDGAGFSGTATSGADGSWEVALPGPGTYRVELDTSTLPEGVALRDPDRSVLEGVEVRAGQHKSVVFAIGDRLVDTAGWPTRLLNLAVKGLIYGSIVALAAVGLSLIFGVTGLVNFAHGEVVTFGAVVAWFFNASVIGPGLHLLWAVLPTLALAGLLGAGWNAACSGRCAAAAPATCRSSWSPSACHCWCGTSTSSWSAGPRSPTGSTPSSPRSRWGR